MFLHYCWKGLFLSTCHMFIIQLVLLLLSSHSCYLFPQQANPLSTSSLLGSNQNNAALHGLEFDLPPYLEAKYNTGSTTNPRPAISMQEVIEFISLTCTFLMHMLIYVSLECYEVACGHIPCKSWLCGCATVRKKKDPMAWGYPQISIIKLTRKLVGVGRLVVLVHI